MTDKSKFQRDPLIRCRDYRIGAIGAGLIMADVQLASYQEAAFPVVAIASRSKCMPKRLRRDGGSPRLMTVPRR